LRKPVSQRLGKAVSQRKFKAIASLLGKQNAMTSKKWRGE
jgi:hypothetical protein